MVFEIKFNDKYTTIYIMEKLEQLGSFLMSNRTYYLHTTKEKQDVESSIGSDNVVKEIKANNYKDVIDNMSRSFCIKSLSDDDCKRYENTKEGQKFISEALNFLDKIEAIQKGAIKVAEEEKKQ